VWYFVNGTGFGGSTCLEDSFDANYPNNSKSFNVYKGSDTPFNFIKDYYYFLSFKINYDLETNKDFCHLVWSKDGALSVDWESIGTITGSSGGQFVNTGTDILTLLGELFPSFYIGFAITSDSANTRDGVYIDDVMLLRAPFIIEGFDYDIYPGTSMAAPYVVGAAGLVIAQNPNYTYLQVRDAVLNSVDTLTTLMGKVAMEGRVNAFKAVTYIAPPFGITASAGTNTITISWQANSESAVVGYNISYGVNSLTENQIFVSSPTTHTIAGLIAGSSYQFAVQAVADFPVAGRAYSLNSEIIRAAPIAPQSSTGGGGGGGGGCFIQTIFQ